MRGLALQLYTVFVHPIFQVCALLACGALFYYNRSLLKPLQAEKNRALAQSANLVMEKNQLLKMMPSLRVEDLDRQMEALKQKVVQNENQANGEAKKIGKAMEECGWSGEVSPQPATPTFPRSPFLKHFPVRVTLTSTPAFSEKQELKDQVRLARFLREVERTRKLHFLRRLEIQADPRSGTRVNLEYDFYSLEDRPRG